MARVPEFTTEKPVVVVRFHRLLGYQRSELMFKVDETVDKFQVEGVDLTGSTSSPVAPAVGWTAVAGDSRVESAPSTDAASGRVALELVLLPSAGRRPPFAAATSLTSPRDV
jgi:hypothetical protein